MITIGYFGIYVLISICMFIGMLIMAMFRVSGDCSKEEEEREQQGFYWISAEDRVGGYQPSGGSETATPPKGGSGVPGLNFAPERRDHQRRTVRKKTQESEG